MWRSVAGAAPKWREETNRAEARCNRWVVGGEGARQMLRRRRSKAKYKKSEAEAREREVEGVRLN